MKILVIEDDNFKADSISNFLSLKFVNSSIIVKTNLAESIEIINLENFNFVMVDMAIPSHPIVSGEGAPISFLTGGLDIILELNALERSDKCIILTQYPEIEISGQFYHINEAKDMIKELLGCSVLGCFEYSENGTNWKTSLENLLDCQ